MLRRRTRGERTFDDANDDDWNEGHYSACQNSTPMRALMVCVCVCALLLHLPHRVKMIHTDGVITIYSSIQRRSGFSNIRFHNDLRIITLSMRQCCIFSACKYVVTLQCGQRESKNSAFGIHTYRFELLPSFPDNLIIFSRSHVMLFVILSGSSHRIRVPERKDTIAYPRLSNTLIIFWMRFDTPSWSL